MHPLEPLTAEEVSASVRLLKEQPSHTPTTRFISIMLREPAKQAIAEWPATAAPPTRGGCCSV